MNILIPVQRLSLRGLAAAGLLVPVLAATQALGAAQPGVPNAGGPMPSGEVIVTEFMKDPATVSDTRGEWIEVHNTLPWRANLEGWTLEDDSGSAHVISNGGAGVYMRPGEYLVLGRSDDPTLNGGVLVDYVYSGFTLSNGADQILLRKRNGRLSDRVDYDDGVTWPDQSGQSISLDASFLSAAANDDPMNWCHSSTPLNAGNSDTGTPGLANESCP